MAGTARAEHLRTTGNGIPPPPAAHFLQTINGKLQVLEGPMRDIRVAWESAKKRAGIDPGFHFHDLRHTFASHQKMAGVDDYSLKAIMGHSDPKMMRRYAHRTPEHIRAAIARLPNWGVTGSEILSAEG